MKPFTLRDFVRESNRIEGIVRPPRPQEVAAHEDLLAVRRKLDVEDLRQFVAAVQPGAILRDQIGLNVRVGSHVAPPGGRAVVDALEIILHQAPRSPWIIDPMATEASWETHHAYEHLHPFTDGNGRSGRALWLWQMGGIDHAPLGFLHTFYYQTLNAKGKTPLSVLPHNAGAARE